MLQHEGAEKSAHETIEAEQERRSTVAQLAAEYETVAQATQHQRCATVAAVGGLDMRGGAEVVGGESFASLVAQLRSSEAGEHQPEQLLSRATGTMVLFGVASSSGCLADTWTWNGTTWTEASPATSPPARYVASMAYDPATGSWCHDDDISTEMDRRRTAQLGALRTRR